MVEIRVSASISGTCDCALAAPIYVNSLASTSSVPAERFTVTCTPNCFRRRLETSPHPDSTVDLTATLQANSNNPAETAQLSQVETAVATNSETIKQSTVSGFSSQGVTVVVESIAAEQGPAPTGAPVQTLAPTPSPTTGPTVNTTSLRFLTIAEVPLRYVGDCEAGECGKCMGGCKDDIDCADGLRCFNRGAQEIVPGCIGGGIHDVEGKYTGHIFINNHTLCILPTHNFHCFLLFTLLT